MKTRDAQTTSRTRPISPHRTICRNLGRTQNRVKAATGAEGGRGLCGTHLNSRGGHRLPTAIESSALTITYQTAAAPMA